MQFPVCEEPFFIRNNSVYHCSHLLTGFWFGAFSPFAFSGHGLLFKTKYEKSLSWQHSQRGIQTPEISQRGDAEVGERAVLKEAGDSTG